MFVGPASMSYVAGDDGSPGNITLMRDFPLAPSSACCTLSPGSVRTYPNVSEAQKHNDTIWRLVYGYSARVDRLFADNKRWSSGS